MPSYRLLSVLIVSFLFAAIALPAQEPAPASPDDAKAAIASFIEEERAKAPEGLQWNAFFPPRTAVADVAVETSGATVTFNESFAERVWTFAEARQLESRLRAILGSQLAPGAPLAIRVRFGSKDDGRDYPLEEIVTSRETIRRQNSAGAPAERSPYPVVQHPDYAGPERRGGLQGRNIVVSASHGWTWHKENRWQLQRARVYTIVEDMFPASFTNPFLIPMLENAGANVFSLRERDYQLGEVIVDNDGQDDLSLFRSSGSWTDAGASGWQGGRPVALTSQEEPFKRGTTLEAPVTDATAEAVYVPYIPHKGRYAVTLSWAQKPTNSPSVPVEIRHLGGTTTVRVNQQVAGNTWVFAGFFEFAQGANEATGSVRIAASGAVASEQAAREGVATTVNIDAVRFGGGWGNIASGNMISGKPRHAEAGLYWALYSGAPLETVVPRSASPGHFGSDYNRDIILRGEWPNYLHDAMNEAPDAEGLHMPVDATIAWHTDAGYDEDGLIGALAIYRLVDQQGDTEFPDGRSRVLNRHLAALVQYEISRVAEAHYSTTWRKRQLRDGNYGEARRPNMPTVLLELLSHHNFNDMKYGLDPRFRFDMSRAVAKAIVRFVAYANGYDPVFAPLAPSHLAVRSVGGGKAVLTWRPVQDPLEPSATPSGYIVYRSADGRAFDNGTWVQTPRYEVSGLEADKTVSFRVTAANAGGESFPTPVVSVRWSEGKSPLLIVDGFDRICGPAIVDNPGARGFDRSADPGVGYGATYALVGDQYDFVTTSEWANDLETPGLGASQSALENSLEPGNTFDHIVKHANAFAESGYAFDSCTWQAYADGTVEAAYPLIDWIAGEQRSTPPPAGMNGVGAPDRMTTEFEVLPADVRSRLRQHVESGGALIVSGAFVGEDLIRGPLANDDSRAFARDVLGLADYAGDATNINTVVPTDAAAERAMKPFFFGRDLEWPINIERLVYPVESAESFSPVAAMQVRMVYGDTREPALVTGNGVALAGFPVETVLPVAARTGLLKTLAEELLAK
ncbi:MAG: hypothetical protein PWP23_987 [Candidatus Sumerlaeota bacterium]|nr:hypothetical protein [Candidatus Sumerlaeota bacterium]